jgi:eukaryotic-like serine/threonine-protein kinase
MDAPSQSTPVFQALKPGSRPSVGQVVLYHCACGHEFRVDASAGGECAHCKRFVQAEALRTAMNATVSIASMDLEHNIHHFEVDESDILSKRKYGHFRLDRKLGSGGMGAVYRALDTSLQRYVAVKVMRNPDQAVKERIATMLREAVAQARLNHPNVVTIYYVGRQDEDPFLAMELLSGPTLAEKLKQNGKIPYADAIRFATQVASALEHASQFGIVHADIKPANLILSGDKSIKLSDFGLSSIQSIEDKKSTISGTPAYVAPELIRGNATSPQSDMYALGITLFELVFGRHPYTQNNPESTIRDKMESHLNAKIDFPVSWPNDVPRGFMTLLNRLMAKDPKDRYADYSELISDLRRLAPVSTTTAGLAPRAMAYAIDQFYLLLFLAPFALAILFLNSDSDLARDYRQYRWIAPILAFSSLIVPGLYLFLTYNGWRSIGRYLFQLQIVDENGLPARKEQLVSREVLRNAFAWFFPLLLYISPNIEVDSRFGDGSLMVRTLEFILVAFLAIDWGLALLLKGRRSLHDYLFRSRVVLAMDRNAAS